MTIGSVTDVSITVLVGITSSDGDDIKIVSAEALGADSMLHPTATNAIAKTFRDLMQNCLLLPLLVFWTRHMIESSAFICASSAIDELFSPAVQSNDRKISAQNPYRCSFVQV